MILLVASFLFSAGVICLFLYLPTPPPRRPFQQILPDNAQRVSSIKPLCRTPWEFFGKSAPRESDPQSRRPLQQIVSENAQTAPLSRTASLQKSASSASMLGKSGSTESLDDGSAILGAIDQHLVIAQEYTTLPREDPDSGEYIYDTRWVPIDFGTHQRIALIDAELWKAPLAAGKGYSYYIVLVFPFSPDPKNALEAFSTFRVEAKAKLGRVGLGGLLSLFHTSGMSAGKVRIDDFTEPRFRIVIPIDTTDPVQVRKCSSGTCPKACRREHFGDQMVHIPVPSQDRTKSFEHMGRPARRIHPVAAPFVSRDASTVDDQNSMLGENRHTDDGALSLGDISSDHEFSQEMTRPLAYTLGLSSKNIGLFWV